MQGVFETVCSNFASELAETLWFQAEEAAHLSMLHSVITTGSGTLLPSAPLKSGWESCGLPNVAGL